MVYRGRPSTGCKKCRERKIKCDERPGGCVKCADRGYPCPGYDRTVDAFFHDETASTRARAKKANAKAIAIRETRDVEDAFKIASETYGLYIPPSLIDQGINYFLHQYSTGMDRPPAHSAAYHQHLSTNGFHPLVASTMTALGLAGVANLHMDSRLRTEAMRWYVKSIRNTNVALSSPHDVKADTTLIAVNLLGMFEATFNDQSFAGWSAHVDGAAALVRARGPDQFKTLPGQRMYLHTIGLLTMNCMGKSIKLPKYVRDLNKEAKKYMDETDPRTAFFFLQMKTVDFRAKLRGKHNFELPEIIDYALELDAIAREIFTNTGPDWGFEVIACHDEHLVCDDFYHIYPTHTAAQTWNWVRYNRIYFHDIIRNAILVGFSTSPPTLKGQNYHVQLGESTRILQETQSAIMATMPQFLQDVSKYPYHTDANFAFAPPLRSRATTPASTSYASTSSSDSSRSSTLSPTSHSPGTHKMIYANFKSELIPNAMFSKPSPAPSPPTTQMPVMRVSGGYSTVWALYVAGSMPTASAKSQDYIYKCLARIETEFGIKQARVLANALTVKRAMDESGMIPFEICPEYLPPDSVATEDLPSVEEVDEMLREGMGPSTGALYDHSRSRVGEEMRADAGRIEEIVDYKIGGGDGSVDIGEDIMEDGDVEEIPRF